MLHFQYRDKASPIHRLSPFCTLAWVTTISVLALIYDHPFYLAVFFLTTLPVVFAAGVRREWSAMMRYTLSLCFLLAAFNVLFNQQGAHVLWQAPFIIPVIGTPGLTLEALIFSAAMSLRLLAIISAFVVLTLTIHPDGLMPVLTRLKFPYRVVLVASLSLRFIPTLLDDLSRLTDVQRSRGVNMDRGNLIQRIRNRSAVILPLLSNSLERAVQLAEAMEARAFGSGAKRSYFRAVRTDNFDRLMLLPVLAALFLGVSARLTGAGSFQYFPSVGNFDIGIFNVAVAALLVFLLSAVVPLSVLKMGRKLD